MKKSFFIITVILSLLMTPGCAIKSPAEWQVAIGTVLFTAFHKGATNLALEELHELHQKNVIDDEEYARLKHLVLESSDEDVHINPQP